MRFSLFGVLVLTLFLSGCSSCSRETKKSVVEEKKPLKIEKLKVNAPIIKTQMPTSLIRRLVDKKGKKATDGSCRQPVPTTKQKQPDNKEKPHKQQKEAAHE